TDLHKRGDGFGVPGMRCDGMDVVDTYEVTTEALRRAREDRRPVLVEAITYRFRGHSMADPEEYRTKEQVEEWRERDPLKTFAARLVDEGMLSEDDVKEIDGEAVSIVDEVRGWYTVDERAAGVHRGERERDEPQDGARREQFQAVVDSQDAEV